MTEWGIAYSVFFCYNINNKSKGVIIMKKTLSLILSLVIIATSVFCFSSTALADETFELSPGITATYVTAEKKLTISGKGETDDYDLSPFVQKGYDTNGKVIESVVIENGITRLGNNLFAGLINIVNVQLPETLESIGSRVFQGCPRIKTLSIPASVTSIDPTGLRTASESIPTQLENIFIDENNKNYCSVDGVLYNKNMTTLICVPSSWAGEKLVIPDTVTTITDLAGVRCRFLKEIVFPRSIKSVGTKAFKNSVNLEHVTILNQDVELNEQLQLFDGATKLVIAGYDNSTAKEYAQLIGVPFHTIVTDKGYAPTCTETGLTDGNHCSVCDKGVVVQNVIPAKGHKYDAGKVTKAATCTATGVKTYTCTVCKATKTETIAKKAHSYKNYVTKATLTANGKTVNKCSVCGSVKSTTVIPMIKTVTISPTNYTYDGKVKTPSVTVKDSKGKALVKNTDYTVSYANGRKYVGKYAVKITFKGKYSGTKTLYFTIKPKATSLTKLTPVKKGFKAYWKKQATQTTGYQIQYATDKAFTKNAKGVFASGAKTTSKSISKLYSKKGYYVRVRTYKTVKFNGRNVNIYSSWSKTMYVKTK